MKVAFLGTGFMAKAHAKALKTIGDVELCAACGSGGPSVAEFGLHAGIPDARLYESFETMMEEVDPDLLYVCLPPAAHDMQVAAAVARGTHVFVEKPLGLTVEAARQMVDAVESSGVTHQVGFQMRFHPAVAELRKRIDSGSVGRPVIFTGRYWTNMDGKPWWRDRTQSGGQMLEQAIHIYDLAAHLMGEADLERASGYLANVVRPQTPDYTIEDLSAGMLPLRTGGLCVVTACNAARRDHYIADFRCVFEHASLDYRCTGQSWVSPDSATLISDDSTETEWTETADLILLENREFIAAVSSGRPSAVPLRDGLRAMEWIDAVHRAAPR